MQGEEDQPDQGDEREGSGWTMTAYVASLSPFQPNSEEKEKRNSASDLPLDLNIPLAVAKERAHQKRTSKRAPQMDWSKKNELFSNL